MTVKWGIAGLGNIAKRFAADLTQHSRNCQLLAVASRDLETAQEFAAKFESPRAYGSYAGLANDVDVDVVYVATIHATHAELIEQFLRAGKHVLVEKPAVLSKHDWLRLTALAEQNDVQLVEAMKVVTFPSYRDLRSFLVEHKVQLTSMSAAFGNQVPFDATDRLFNPDCAGGATWDVGVYPLWLYCDLCQALGYVVPEPRVEIVQDYPDSLVDDYVQFQFEGAFSATLSAAISRDLDRTARIYGPETEIIITEKWWNPCHITIKHQGALLTLSNTVRGGGFVYEIEHMNERVISNTASEWICSATSEQVISIMENALE